MSLVDTTPQTLAGVPSCPNKAEAVGAQPLAGIGRDAVRAPSTSAVVDTADSGT